FWLISGPVAFAAYKIITTVGFKAVHLRTTSGNSDAPRLALLRVFTLGKRAERLVEALATHWRYVGSIQLIAGPDLARVTIQPHQLRACLQGRLAGALLQIHPRSNAVCTRWIRNRIPIGATG